MRRFATFCALLAALCACGKHHPDDDFVANVKHLTPSVVLLTMQVPGESRASKVDDAYATGIVVASDASGSDVVTVQHAIEGAWNLHVTLNNKQRVPGKVIAKDNGLDVALVRVPHTRLPAAVLGSQSDAQPGRTIGLLGYPIPDQFDDEGLGLATSLNEGRISSFRHDAIEVTLPIVPGESGSPIFLADNGEIVGMAESRFDEEHSIGFALPADDIKKFLHRVDRVHGF
ncbi:MAG: trypsin-like peptidase domain-containing protein [Candidatus Eremiobacteraeota bacterium]|nr:trypsin-like peptidase domain-containing protein [Candidatus Eremiobacteraeota bacterium]